MSAPARVLRKEKCTAPRLALVDNVGIGETIVAEAQRQQHLHLLDPDRVTPVNRKAPRRPKPETHRNGPVEIRWVVPTIGVNQVALGVAELIQARHGGYIQIINSTTVAVVNHPPKGKG